MAHVTGQLNTPASLGLWPRWMVKVSSFLNAWKENRAHRQWAAYMLSYDDRLLNDIGLTRGDLIEIAGSDPRFHSTIIQARIDPVLNTGGHR